MRRHGWIPLFIAWIKAQRLLRVRRYIIFNWIAGSILVAHLLFRAFASSPSAALDIYLYNSVVLFALIALLQAPLHNDPLAIAFMAAAIGIWSLGSITSSLNQFFVLPATTQLIANIAYTLFYPFALIAIPRMISHRKKLRVIELLDSVIFGLGLGAIVTALLLAKVLPRFSDSPQEAFFSVLFPLCDISLIIVTLISVATQKINRRLVLLSSGVLIFALSDFLYLWFNVNGKYHFGQVSDDGWLLGILLISLAFWYRPGDSVSEGTIHPVFIALSVFLSPTLLAVMALRPGIFPEYILIPTIATLFLAFIRMTIVLRQARNLGEEKVLARTDELTGLPNRRRLIAEISSFGGSKGALLLLDLNGFKPVNDQYGHEQGDQVLRQVALRFSRTLPTGAILARLGGDEFGVLIPGIFDVTMEVANALHATLSYPFTISGESIKIGVSIGHVQNDGNGELLARADAAMYEAKRGGLSVVNATN